MKKLFLMAVAAVAMLATSCSKDDTNAVAVGEKSTVTFAVEAPVMATRADLGKAENVDQLYYAVYSENGETHYPELSGVKNNAFSNLKATVEIELVNGKAYTVVFWAQNSQAPYTFDGRNAKVTVNYDDEFIGNQDSYDAFYKTHSVATVNGARTEKEIILTRPFAQLNIATADYKTAINGGFTLQEVQVEVPAYSTLNFLKLDENGNATVENVENVETTRVFNFADIFTTEQITVGSKDYKLLSMNYILINTKELETVKFIAKQEGNLTQTYTYNNVPLQRNYKTNIVGNLLTSTLDFDITIDPIFEEYEYGYVVTEEGGQTVATVSTPSGLAQLAEDINDGKLDSDTNIVLDGDIDLSSLTRAAVSNWTPIGTEAEPFTGTFDGKGYTIKNLVIDGGSQINIGFFGVTMNGEIKNVTFENAKVSGRLNVGVVAGTPYTSKYTNITVKGHVEVDGMAYVGAVGGKNAYANWTNVTVNVDETSYVNANSVENGTAYRSYVGGVVGFNGEGGHTFSNIYSNINVKGSTCDVGGLFGIAHYSNNFVNCVCEGDVEIYAASEEAEAQEIGGIAGVWHNENGTKVTFTNCSFTGELKANNNYVINTKKFGNLVCSSYNNTGKGILVIDGIEYSLVDGDVVINGCTPVSTADELIAALEANEGVYLLNDIKIEPAAMSNAYGTTGINVKNGQTIDGAGHTLNIKGAGGTWDSGINTTGGIIRNITVTGSFRGIFINHTSTHSEKVVLENVTLRDVVYTISCDQGLYQTIEANNCSFYGWTSFAKTAGEAKFVNCYFGEGPGYKFCRPYSNTEFVGCTFCPGYAVDTTRATVTFTDCIWQE